MSFPHLISLTELNKIHSECVLIDCRFSLADEALGEQHYLAGHLPQARYANLNTQLSSKIRSDSGRHPLPDFEELAKQCSDWGIANNTQVVVYDDVGGGFASRLWWLLRTLGHSKVALLDGGIAAWTTAGLPLEKYLPTVTPQRFIAQLDEAAWLNTEQVLVHMKNKKFTLVDARDKPRFDGVLEPIDPIAGHIPGSINLPVAQNINDQGLFLSAEVLRQRYAPLMEYNPAEEIVHSCGSGVFACLGVLAMQIAGFEGSKIYAGSWSEWIRDPARPVGTNI